jgi:hypothetical protein
MYNYQARSNPFAYRKPMAKKIPVNVTLVTAEQVWAAAALADRVNAGAYHKEPQRDKDNYDVVVFEANRAIMNRALGQPTEITAEDIELGRLARAWHKNRLLMVAIKRPLTGFEDNLSKAAGMDEFALEIHKLEIATIASQIRSFRNGFALEEKMWGTTTAALAEIGTKVLTTAEVVGSFYSVTYNTTYIRAVTIDTRNVIMFSYREMIAVGTVITVKGTVKAHREDCTQLNRVSVLKQVV